MSIINYASREIQFKIVYYGPALCGKTTNLSYIHQRINPLNLGDLVSLDQRKIPLLHSGPGQDIAPGIPKARRPICQRLPQSVSRKAVHIKPRVDRLRSCPIANAVGPRRARAGI